MQFRVEENSNLGGYMMGVSDLMTDEQTQLVMEKISQSDVQTIYRELVMIGFALERQEALLEKLLAAKENGLFARVARFFKNLLS
jgi:hypothetical protein